MEFPCFVSCDSMGEIHILAFQLEVEQDGKKSKSGMHEEVINDSLGVVELEYFIDL